MHLEASGSIWEASGRHLACIWQASRKHPPQVFPPSLNPDNHKLNIEYHHFVVDGILETLYFGITCSHLGDHSELWQDTTTATKSKVQLYLALWQLGGRFGVVCGDLLGSFGAPWPPFQHIFWPWNLSGDALEAISGGHSKKHEKTTFGDPPFEPNL